MTKIEKAKTAVDQAEQAVLDAEEALSKAQKEKDEAYNCLVDVRANYEAGQGKKADCDEAEKAHTKAVTEAEQAQVNKDVAGRTLEIQQRKLRDTVEARKSETEAKVTAKLPAVITEIQQTYDAFIKANNRLQELRDEARKGGLTPNETNDLIPQPFTNLMQPKPGRKLSSYELSAFISFDNWISNYKSITNSKKTG